MPTVGIGGVTSHLTVGTGAIVPYQLIPPSVRNQFGLSPLRPNALFVQLRPGVTPCPHVELSIASTPRWHGRPTTR